MRRLQKYLAVLLAGALLLTSCAVEDDPKITREEVLHEEENLSVRRRQYEDGVWSLEFDMTIKGTALSSEGKKNLEQMKKATDKGITLSDGSVRVYVDVSKMRQTGLASYDEAEKLLGRSVLRSEKGKFIGEGNQLGVSYDIGESIVSIVSSQQRERKLSIREYVELSADPAKELPVSLGLSGEEKGEYATYITARGKKAHLLYCLSEKQARACIAEEGVLYYWEIEPLEGRLKMKQIKDFLDTIS